MTNNKFEKICIKEIVNYVNENIDKTDLTKIDDSNVYIVWLSKTLQNNKALVSTTLSDGKYYELTYNGDTNELYIDVYVKLTNICKKVDD